MAKPDYIICLECESEIDEFTWREDEIRRAVCDVCGNNDPDAFALPEDFEQDFEDDGEEDEEYFEDPDEDEEEDEEN